MEILNKMRKEDPDIDDEEYCETFKILERKEIIRNIKPNEDQGSYTLCKEMLYKSYMKETENDLQEKIITILTDQVNFLKAEVLQKNKIIQRLLTHKPKSPHKNKHNHKHGNECELEEKSDLFSFPKFNYVEESDTASITNADENQNKLEIQKPKQDQKQHVEQQQKQQQQQQYEDNKHKAKLLNDQLINIRKKKHEKYIEEKCPVQVKLLHHQKEKNENKGNGNNSNAHLWKPNTVLIVGDSILNGVVEKRIGTNVKVRSFSGAIIKDT